MSRRHKGPPVTATQTDSAGSATMTGHTTGKPLMDDQPADVVEELRQQLQGKDELIAALVAELEQVVEQLDRAKRTGDRPRPGSPSAGLPAEVVEEHQQMLSDLQRVIQQWEEFQSGNVFGRIESELADLRTMMMSAARTERFASRDSSDLEGVMTRLAEQASNRDADEPSGAAWDAMKRQMLDEKDAVEADADDDPGRLLDGITAPTAIDVEEASLEVLKRASAERDAYIVQLIRLIRARRSVALPENWEEIVDIPDELRQRVEHLASRLEEQVRLAEVEMSLERARLSREKSLLQSERATLDRHMKRLGIASLDELEEITVSSSSSGDRRWMRFLGVNRKS